MIDIQGCVQSYCISIIIVTINSSAEYFSKTWREIGHTFLYNGMYNITIYVFFSKGTTELFEKDVYKCGKVQIFCRGHFTESRLREVLLGKHFKT